MDNDVHSKKSAEILPLGAKEAVQLALPRNQRNQPWMSLSTLNRLNSPDELERLRRWFCLLLVVSIIYNN